MNKTVDIIGIEAEHSDYHHTPTYSRVVCSNPALINKFKAYTNVYKAYTNVYKAYTNVYKAYTGHYVPMHSIILC